MTQPALRSRLSGADHEERLARAAAGGSSRAFLGLYRRYETRVFQLAFRITGSGDLAAQATRDAFTDTLDAMSHLDAGGAPFGSCVLIAARNRSIELAAGAPEPGEEEPQTDDPFESDQHAIRHAVFRLEDSEREILALGQVDGMAAGAIATIMDIGGEDAPELMAQARLGLHDELWGADPEVVTPTTDDCAQALPLTALRDDGQLDDEEDRAWLVEHLAHCHECRLRLDAMERAQAAYERWAPVAPPAGLLEETSAASARFRDADASESATSATLRRPAEGIAAGLAGLRGAARRRREGPPGERPSAAAAAASAGAAAASTMSAARAAASRAGSSVRTRRPGSDHLVTAGWIVVTLFGLLATVAGASLVVGGGDGSKEASAPASEADAVGARPQPVQAPQRKAAAAVRAAQARAAARKRKVRVIQPTPAPQVQTNTAPQTIKPKRTEVPTAVAVPVPKPAPKPTPPKPAPKPKEPPAVTTPQTPTPPTTTVPPAQ